MAAYNTEAFIGEAVASVLSQTFKDFELLVVNDGSTDKTVEVVQRFEDPRIKLVHNPQNKGLTYTRNRALTHARGKYIAVLDSDDVAVPYRLELQHEYMEGHPEVALCGGHAELIDARGQAKGQTFIEPVGSEINPHMLFGNPFVNSTVIFKKDVLIELGGYRDFAVAEDFDFFLRTSEKYPVANIDEVLVKYRIHGNNTSSMEAEKTKEIETTILKEMYQKWGVPVDEQRLESFYSLYAKDHSRITLEEMLWALQTLKEANRRSERFSIEAFEALLFQKWYDAIMVKQPGKGALALLLDSRLFDFSFVTFKQLRRVFKQSFWAYFKT